MFSRDIISVGRAPEPAETFPSGFQRRSSSYHGFSEKKADWRANSGFSAQFGVCFLELGTSAPPSMLNKPGAREILARSWFNIGDRIAYRLVVEIRGGRVRASWKNMLNLETSVDPAKAGYSGFFVDRGDMLITDLKLERLPTG
jgi:hypothetical protein